MKLKGALILSFGLNLTLLAGLWMADRQPQDAVDVSLDQAAEPERVKTPSRKAGAREGGVPIMPPQDFNWSQLESQDYRIYIDNLRAVGCPEETLRDIIIADVNKLYAQRRAELLSQMTQPFWQTGRGNRDARRDRDDAIRSLEREKKALIKDLLGVDLDSEMARWFGPDEGDMERYGFLPPEKQEQFKNLVERYRDMERELFAQNGRGPMTPEMREQMDKIRSEREAAMKQMLTPAEYEEYQLRNSFTAMRMRDTLTSFEPTEQEFKEIFKLRQSFDEQYGFRRGEQDEAAQAQRQAAEQQLEAQLRSTLGEQRYQEYQLANDDRYRQSYEFAQRFELPKETAVQIYDMRKVAETEMKNVMSDATLNDDQRQAVLALLAEETRNTFSATLGDNFDNYIGRGGGGGWIEALSRGEEARGWDRRGRFGGFGGGPPPGGFGGGGRGER